jgi:hypothetical protein
MSTLTLFLSSLPLYTVKTAISEKALELEGWKELLKNKTWEVSKPNITVRGKRERGRRRGEKREKRGGAGFGARRYWREASAFPSGLALLVPPFRACASLLAHRGLLSAPL